MAVDDIRKKYYEDATALDATELNNCFSGGENSIETIAIIEKTVDAVLTTLRLADRPKYVGSNFYYGRAKFPNIKRTLGELQSPSIQFSEMEIEFGNMDGFYNRYLVGGADYFSPIGASLTVQIGLRDVASSFMTIYKGEVPEDDGFERGRESLSIRARDVFTQLNKKIPLPPINEVDFPSAPPESIGKIIPMVLGDWEAGYNVTPNAGTISISDGMTTTNVLTDAPGNFFGGVSGINVGGGFFVFSIGTYTPDNIANAHIRRGDALIQVNFTAAPQNTAGYWSLEVLSLNVDGGGTTPYVYQQGDIATIAVKVPYAAGKYSNPIELAQEILFTLGGKSSGDLDASSWNALKTKNTPAQSDMTSILARLWIGKAEDVVLGRALSLLEQVRVELYINSIQKIAVKSLHPEDFPTLAAMTRVEQYHINETSVKVKGDDRTFFNAALGNYGYTPILDKTQLQTVQRKNQNSVDKSGKLVAKAIDLPDLYVSSHVLMQIDEFIRFYSMGIEYVTVEVAWPHLLRELGEFINFNYSVGGLDFPGKPMQIRSIEIDPSNGSVEFKLLSFANFPYPNYSPANAARFLSASDATITDV